MIYPATVTSQGQVTIPAKVREELGIQKKDRINFVVEKKGRVVVEPVPDILDLYGAFKTKKKIPFKVARKAFGEYLARRSLKTLP